MAEKTLTTMQRMAVRAVRTLKHLQQIKKGSGLTLSLVVLGTGDVLRRRLLSPSTTSFVDILSRFLRSEN
ncbi:hypothetical protein C1H46_045762 [Malus baccata]|uniref:Uncharacterized protein n=1 Tax=Malus baccata TaxID=106549 RepID=A0A540K370_MALBA|nr:hypothetical protein C1H46_045762 [Malus baccata]